MANPEVKAFDSAVESSIQSLTLNVITASNDIVPGPDKTSNAEVKDKIVPKADTDIQPKKPIIAKLAEKDKIATAYSRFPLIPRRRLNVSTFTPTLFNYYTVIHYMDSLIADNLYFERTGQLWHPFISRLYLGALVYIQTLRAMNYAKIGSLATRQLINQVLTEIPPERLPVPGPVLPILKSICATQSEDPLYGLICPSVPDNPGPQITGHVLPTDDFMLAMPNLPLITGFINSIIHTEDDIPDYTSRHSFDDTENHIINGHVYPADQWTQEDRSSLLQPGMSYRPETNRDYDDALHHYGYTLDLPVFNEDSHLLNLSRYTMFTQIAWLERLIPIMATYSSFFKESGTLGHCSPFGPQTGLISSKAIKLTSNTAADNAVFTLDAAFPNRYPYKLIYDQRSYEISIPQPYALMAQYSCINTRCHYRGLNGWSRINLTNQGRFGPYWTERPFNLKRTPDEGFLEIEDILSRHYYIENPT